jgi:Phage tail assembly chaperone protein
MIAAYTLFERATGRVVGYAGTPAAATGCVAVAGEFDGSRWRWDEGDSRVMAFQPAAPVADEWQTWAWDAGAWSWVSVPTGAALARDARAQRDQLLLSSDWTDTASAPARLGGPLYSAWQAYRQSLRDISAQNGFPFAWTLPVPPASST